ncbi:MAG: restriction endonuclease subunit S [Xanthomonadales bacterium]|nr:restriction endonuclease subunit S [Xanthomonadales bacterium]
MSWQLTPLGQLTRIRTGKLDANANSPDGAYPFFTCAREPLRIATYSYDCECVLVAGNGDLNVKYHFGKFDAYQRTYIIESNSKERLDVRYLFHFMDNYLDRLRTESIGGIIKYIKLDNLTEALIPLPSLPEQRRVAAILDKAAELRAKRREAIAKLDQLLQSMFIDMFGDAKTNSKGWPISPVSEVAECLDRLRRPVTARDRVAGDVPYYGANGQQGWIDRPIFNEPLVLVAEDGGHFEQPERGVAYRIDGPSWVNNHAHILRANSGLIETEFLHRALRHFDFMPYISGSTRAKLTQGQLNAIPVMVPPIHLQIEFARRIEGVQAQAALVYRSSKHLDAMFSSLQHRAFTGTL